MTLFRAAAWAAPLLGLSLLATTVPASAAPCRDSHGRFARCPGTAAKAAAQPRKIAAIPAKATTKATAKAAAAAPATKTAAAKPVAKAAAHPKKAAPVHHS